MLKTDIELPKVGALAGTRAALGLGIGLLVADRIEPRLRRRAGIVLVAIGAISTVPLVVAIVRGVEHPS